MAGPIPGAGRKKAYYYIVNGERFGSYKEASEKIGVPWQTIRNWCNAGKKNCSKRPISESFEPGKPKDEMTKESAADQAISEGITPLEFLLKIMRDEDEAPDRREKCAYWALPYMHAKPVAGGQKKGKKEEMEERAEKASSGKFAAGKPPLSLVK